MPQYEGTEVLTAAVAKTTERIVDEWFKNKGHTDNPAMYRPGHEGPMWVLSLEGCEDWAVQIAADESVKWPAGVFAEPVADWCLGLYPAPDPAVSGEGERLAMQWEAATAHGNQWAQQRIGAEMARFLQEH